MVKMNDLYIYLVLKNKKNKSVNQEGKLQKYKLHFYLTSCFLHAM